MKNYTKFPYCCKIELISEFYMKKCFVSLLSFSIFLVLGCENKNKEPIQQAQTTASVETPKNEEKDPLLVLQGKIALEGAKKLEDYVNQEYKEISVNFPSYTVAVGNLKHAYPVEGNVNGLEVFTWDVNLTNQVTGHTLICAAEEVVGSTIDHGLGLELSESCAIQLIENIEAVNEQIQPEQAVIPATAPVKISFKRNESWDHMSTLQVQALVDQVIITGVNVNRGKCSIEKVAPDQVLNLPLGFSNYRSFTLYCNPRDILEVNIQTDQGGWTFNP